MIETKSVLELLKMTSFEGAMAAWLVCLTPDQASARHSKLPLQYPMGTNGQWVLANLMLGVTLQWTNIPSRGE